MDPTAQLEAPHTFEKVLICFWLQRICSMLAHIGQQAPGKQVKHQGPHCPLWTLLATAWCCYAHQVGLRGGSLGLISVNRTPHYTQNLEPNRTGPLWHDRGLRSQQPHGQRRPHTLCCTSHRCDHRLLFSSCRPPEDRVWVRFSKL